jgi:hypothetical protein
MRCPPAAAAAAAQQCLGCHSDTLRAEEPQQVQPDGTPQDCQHDPIKKPITAESQTQCYHM